MDSTSLSQFRFYIYIINELSFVKISEADMSYAFLFKYIIIGDSGVGKSCLLLQYTDKRYRQKHEVTIGVQFGAKLTKVNENNIKLQIWDTAGQQSFKAITRGYYRNAIGAIVCYDVSNKQSFGHVARWFQEAKSNGPPTLNFILVGNKSDKNAERKVTFEEGLRFAKQLNIPFLQTSAKNGNHVEQIFQILTGSVIEKIQNGTVQVQGHPGIKIGQQKFKSANEHFNSKDTEKSEKFDIKKPNNNKKKGNCVCSK